MTHYQTTEEIFFLSLCVCRRLTENPRNRFDNSVVIQRRPLMRTIIAALWSSSRSASPRRCVYNKTINTEWHSAHHTVTKLSTLRNRLKTHEKWLGDVKKYGQHSCSVQASQSATIGHIPITGFSLTADIDVALIEMHVLAEHTPNYVHMCAYIFINSHRLVILIYVIGICELWIFW